MTYPRLPKELTSERGVQKHIAKIRHYWWARGHTKVDAWAVPMGLHRKRPVFGVRSNLVDGVPR